MPSPNSFQPPSARSHHQPDHRKQDHHKPAEKSGSELYLRANCDLVESTPTAVKLDTRGGDHVALEALSITAADELLAEALTEAERTASVDWHGQVFEVVGNPDIYSAATAESAEE